MPASPAVDVNLFAYESEATVADAIESVLAQTWPAIRLTLIDDGSTDRTGEIMARYAARDPRIALKRNRVRGGAIPAFQRGFWFGDADFVMPKSGDDLIEPDFVARLMDVLLAHPDCAMCHAGSVIFTAPRALIGGYPAAYRLDAATPDPVDRATHVMLRYTSAPAFWGVYRRTAADALSPIRYRAGWDHVLLAELALHGTIRHVPEPLYWRRDGGKPVLHLARAATAQGNRGTGLDDDLGELRWRTPLITTAYAHIEMFAECPLPPERRMALMRVVPRIFRARWLTAMRAEAAALRDAMPALLARMDGAPSIARGWMVRTIADVLQGVAALVPEEEFSETWRALAPACLPMTAEV